MRAERTVGRPYRQRGKVSLRFSSLVVKSSGNDLRLSDRPVEGALEYIASIAPEIQVVLCARLAATEAGRADMMSWLCFWLPKACPKLEQADQLQIISSLSFSHNRASGSPLLDAWAMPMKDGEWPTLEEIRNFRPRAAEKPAPLPSAPERVAITSHHAGPDMCLRASNGTPFFIDQMVSIKRVQVHQKPYRVVQLIKPSDPHTVPTVKVAGVDPPSNGYFTVDELTKVVDDSARHVGEPIAPFHMFIGMRVRYHPKHGAGHTGDRYYITNFAWNGTGPDDYEVLLSLGQGHVIVAKPGEVRWPPFDPSASLQVTVDAMRATDRPQPGNLVRVTSDWAVDAKHWVLEAYSRAGDRALLVAENNDGECRVADTNTLARVIRPKERG